MPPKAELKDLTPETPLKDAVVHFLKYRTKEMLAVANNAKLTDDDTVHDIRVAARRLQALLDTFAEILPQNILKKSKTKTKKIIKLLGKMRENDVSVNMIQKFLGKNKRSDGSELLNLLIAKMESGSAQSRKNVLKDNKVFDYINYFNNQFLKDINLSNKKEFIATKYINPEVSIRSNGVLIMPMLYDKVIKLSKKMKDDAGNEKELHKMRIKTKPLRYTMEIFKPVFGNDFDELLAEMKDFVEILGDIHDKDVLIEILDEHLAEIKAFNKLEKDAMDPGLTKTFIKELKSSRKKEFSRIIDILKKWEKENFREKLILALTV